MTVEELIFKIQEKLRKIKQKIKEKIAKTTIKDVLKSLAKTLLVIASISLVISQITKHGEIRIAAGSKKMIPVFKFISKAEKDIENVSKNKTNYNSMLSEEEKKRIEEYRKQNPNSAKAIQGIVPQMMKQRELKEKKSWDEIYFELLKAKTLTTKYEKEIKKENKSEQKQGDKIGLKIKKSELTKVFKQRNQRESVRRELEEKERQKERNMVAKAIMHNQPANKIKNQQQEEEERLNVFSVIGGVAAGVSGVANTVSDIVKKSNEQVQKQIQHAKEQSTVPKSPKAPKAPKSPKTTKATKEPKSPSATKSNVKSASEVSKDLKKQNNTKSFVEPNLQKKLSPFQQMEQVMKIQSQRPTQEELKQKLIEQRKAKGMPVNATESLASKPKVGNAEYNIVSRNAKIANLNNEIKSIESQIDRNKFLIEIKTDTLKEYEKNNKLSSKNNTSLANTILTLSEDIRSLKKEIKSQQQKKYRLNKQLQSFN